MSGRVILREQYEKGRDLLNFVVYASTTALGEDEVLQHKLLGVRETAHITAHPDGSVNFRVQMSKDALRHAVQTNLAGFQPAPSERLRAFLRRVKPHIGA